MTCVKEKHFAEAKFSLYFMQNLAEGVVSELSHLDCAEVHRRYFTNIAGAHSALQCFASQRNLPRVVRTEQLNKLHVPDSFFSTKPTSLLAY